jgi:hypothetical protein
VSEIGNCCSKRDGRRCSCCCVLRDFVMKLLLRIIVMLVDQVRSSILLSFSILPRSCLCGIFALLVSLPGTSPSSVPLSETSQSFRGTLLFPSHPPLIRDIFSLSNFSLVTRHVFASDHLQPEDQQIHFEVKNLSPHHRVSLSAVVIAKAHSASRTRRRGDTMGGRSTDATGLKCKTGC